MVDVEAMVGVLDQRDAQAGRRQARNQILQQRGLARAGIAGEPEYFHVCSCKAGTVNTGAKPPPGVRKLVVCPCHKRAAINCT